MIEDHGHGAYSAHVEMELLINGASRSVTQLGPDFVFVEPGDAHPPCEATFVLQVDQSEHRWQVKLPEGIAKDSARVILGMCSVVP